MQVLSDTSLMPRLPLMPLFTVRPSPCADGDDSKGDVFPPGLRISIVEILQLLHRTS